MGFAIAGATAAGAAISSSASSSAASTEANAANNASNTELSMYNQTRQDQMPWLQSGQAALGQLNQQLPNLTRGFTMADFQADPGYNFTLQQGQQAIERSAAARGGLNSGATMKSLAGYTTGLANQTYDDAFNRFNTTQSNAYNRLAGMAGVGQTAAQNIGAAGTSTANSVGANQTSAGNAAAAGQIAAGNNINSAIGGGMNSWMQNQILNRVYPQQASPGVPGSGADVSTYGNYDNALGNYNYGT